MKFGYRDRIALLIICVVVILGIGIFVFVKPKYEKLQKAEKAYKDASDAWDLKLSDFDKIPSFQKYIKEKRDKAYDISTGFTDEMDAIQLDQFLQEKFFNTPENVKYKTRLKGTLAVSDEGATSIGYYYYTPSIITYPLVEYADLDGSLSKAVEAKRAESNLLSSRAPQAVGVGSANFTVRMTYDNCMAFIDAVKDYAKQHSDAMILNSISFEDCEFNGRIAADRDDEGELTGSRPEGLPKKYDKVDDKDLGYTNVVVNYSVFYMQEPTQVDVGDEYNKSIWDGNEWRSIKLPETEAAQ